MRGDQHDAVMGKLREQFSEAHPLPRVKPAGGFVQDQDFRFVEQCLGYADAPFHTAGQLDDLFVFDMGEGQLLQQAVDPAPSIPFRQSFQDGNIGEIVFYGEFRIKSELLGKVAEDIPVAFAQLLNGDSVVPDRPGGGLHDAGDDAHQGGLSRAVRAQQSPDAGGEPQGDIVHRFHVFELFYYIFYI